MKIISEIEIEAMVAIIKSTENISTRFFPEIYRGGAELIKQAASDVGIYNGIDWFSNVMKRAIEINVSEFDTMLEEAKAAQVDIWEDMEETEYVAVRQKGGSINYGVLVSVDNYKVTFEAPHTVLRENIVDSYFTNSKNSLDYWVWRTMEEVFMARPTDKERYELSIEMGKYLMTEYHSGLTIDLLIEAILEGKIPGVKWVQSC